MFIRRPRNWVTLSSEAFWFIWFSQPLFQIYSWSVGSVPCSQQAIDLMTLIQGDVFLNSTYIALLFSSLYIITPILQMRKSRLHSYGKKQTSSGPQVFWLRIQFLLPSNLFALIERHGIWSEEHLRTLSSSISDSAAKYTCPVNNRGNVTRKDSRKK